MKIPTVCLLALSCIAPAMAREFFVSPAGDDRNPGSLTSPFGTLARARDAIRELPATTTGDIVVNLRGGTYALAAPVSFDARDSGRNGNRVIYQAYRDERPVLSGGEPVRGWRRVGNVLWEAPIGDRLFRQLYIDGVRAVRARTPNYGSFHRIIDWDHERRTIRIPAASLTDWPSFQQIELHLQMGWALNILRLDSYEWSESEAALIIQDPERYIVFRRDSPRKHANQAFHLENHVSFIDQPGEWALDRERKVITYWPRAGEDLTKAEVIAPRLETLIDVGGFTDSPVKNIVFRGLTFRHSNWAAPFSRGYLNLQAGQTNLENTLGDYQFVQRPPAAVKVRGAEAVDFLRCTFEKLGAVGLDYEWGTRSIEVAGNVFQDIAGSGLCMGKFSDPDVEIHVPYNPADPREVSQDARIHNNYVTRVGLDYGGSIGILCGWVRDVTIEHNHLEDLTYSGISVGWGWTHEPSAMRNIRILRNRIHRPMTLFADGGGIYTLSEMPGSVIAFNHLSGLERSPVAVGASVKGIHLDEGSGGITLEKNLIQGAPTVERLRCHQPGRIVILPESRADYPAIAAGAGLQEAYRDIQAPPPSR